MDNFLHCFMFSVAFEGGFTANAADAGNWTGGVVGQGVLNGTSFGISAAAYPNLNISELSRDAAEKIYQRDYWTVVRGDDLPLPVAMTVFDAAVNAGAKRAVIWLQQAANVVADGELGPVSLSAINERDAEALARESLSRRIDYTARLPTWSVFGLGWSRRFVALARELAA